MSTGSGNWIRQPKRWAVHVRDGLRCQWCGVVIPDVESYTLDHLRPRSQGGGHGESNLVTSCHGCNSLRRDMAWWEFASLFPGARGRIERARRRSIARHRKMVKRLISSLGYQGAREALIQEAQERAEAQEMT